MNSELEKAAPRLLNLVKAELCAAIIKLDDLPLGKIAEIAAVLGVEIDFKLVDKNYE